MVKLATSFGLLLTVALAVRTGSVAAQDDGGYDYSDPSDGAVEAPANLSTPLAIPKRPEQMTSGFGADHANEATPPTTPTSAQPSIEPTTVTAEAPTGAPPASASAGPTPTPLPRLSKAVENLKWEASLAENSYNLDKSEGSTLALIVAYERLIGPLCMPELHRTLAYLGSPSDPRCLEIVEKVVALDPENPLVLCARDGIDAKSCRSAFAAQRVETFSPGRSTTTLPTNTPRPTDGLNEQLAVSSTESKIQPILGRIKMLEYQIRPNKPLSPEDTETLVKSYREGLNLSCRLSRLELRSNTPTGGAILRTAPTIIATPTQPPLFPGLAQGTKRKSPFDEVLEQFGGASPTPPPVGLKDSRTRVRKITDTCKQFIDRALKFDQTMALPVCYRDGFFTPSCIDARRKEGTGVNSREGSGSVGKPATNQGSSNAGFSTF